MTNAFLLRRITGMLPGLLFPFLAICQIDTTAPHLVCKGALQVGMPSCGQLFDLQATYFLEDYTDEVTPTTQIALGARRMCMGSGFPETPQPFQFHPLYFLYYDVFHVFPLEIWARDQAGNTAMCTTSIYLYDPIGNCDPSVGVLTNFAGTADGLPGVTIDIVGHRCAGDTLKFQGLTLPFIPSYAGWMQFGSSIPSGYQTTITPTKKTNPLNGITMHDLFLISQHIQGSTLLTNPYQLIAADANQDGQITDDDRLFLRRLMKGEIKQFPEGRSWRFVPADFVFDPLHPFIFPENIQVADTTFEVPQSFQFRGVKIGDVDFSADPAQ